jgi:hypothetical protein
MLCQSDAARRKLGMQNFVGHMSLMDFVRAYPP